MRKQFKKGLIPLTEKIMRIISGTHKRKIIKLPKSFKARPTTDIAKEGLFNIILNNFYFEEIKVLDLFSGTGSISYEFASRGVKNITCVEINQKHFSFIHKTIKELKFESQIKVKKNSLMRFCKSCKESFDIIFADPPFDLENLEIIPDLIFDNNLDNENAWVIVEHPIRIDFSKHQYFYEKRKYGLVNFSIFTKN